MVVEGSLWLDHDEVDGYVEKMQQTTVLRLAKTTLSIEVTPSNRVAPHTHTHTHTSAERPYEWGLLLSVTHTASLCASVCV